MHNYYRAIGFSKGNTKAILREISKKAIDEYKLKGIENSIGKLMGIYIQFGKDIGMVIHGEFLENGEFEIEYSFPAVNALRPQYYEQITIEKNAGSYSFSAVCEGSPSAISIIFYLKNTIDYVNAKLPQKISAEVGFSGLSLEGKIILPIKKSISENKKYELIRDEKNKLISEAKKGNEEAIETLTFDEMDVYSKISKRVQKEDILSIIDTSFMPFGIECDRYAVVGEILAVNESVNCVTGEKLYNLLMECNDVIMNVMINKMDLEGVPEVGRRFKGNIWLQGNINFQDA